MLQNVWGALILMAYYLLICVLIPTLFKVWLRVPDEIVRKTQHMAYSFSIFLLLRLFTTWYAAVLAALMLVVLGYPALLVLERFGRYREFLVDREARGGELRRQLVYVQLSFGLLIFLFWGILGTDWRYLIAVAVMAWGFGDAAAALVGKYFGRRNFVHRYIEGAKTYEGTAAMILTAGLALFFTLAFYGGKPLLTSFCVSILVAPVCGVVELFSWKGTDTLTVPLSAAVLILPLMRLFAFIR